nr:putative movement protein 2 [Jasmine virus H]
MAWLNPHLLILSVLTLSQLLITSPSLSAYTFDLRLAPPNLLICIVLCIFFCSILSPAISVSYYYHSSSTSDKFITVSVGNGSQ